MIEYVQLALSIVLVLLGSTVCVRVRVLVCAESIKESMSLAHYSTLYDSHLN